jgi:ABC-type polysaccharide/polyol phosphate export permease
VHAADRGFETPTAQAVGPPSDLRFRRAIRFGEAIREVWRAHELVRSLVEREVRAQYKQAILGFAWAMITPVAFMLVFSVFFRRVATVDTAGVPYALFTYVGLVPWTFFSASISRGGMSLVANASLLSKVYCPREVFPVAAMISASIDSIIATLVMGLLFIFTGFAPKATTIYVPLLLLIQLAFTASVTLAVAAVMVYFRDLRHALPLLLQFGLFATPVAYGLEVIPEALRTIYAMLNPLGPVIDGYRRTVLFGRPPAWDTLLPAALSSVVLLVAAYWLFKQLETGIADVA